MAKEKHATSTLIDRLGNWQRKLRFVAGMLPTQKLPLLTQAEAFGPDVERFRNNSQALISWRDKQSQWWCFTGHLVTSHGRPIGFQLAFFDHRTQNDFLGAVPARWITPRTFAAHFTLTDSKNADPNNTFKFWQRGGLLSSSNGFAADDKFHIEIDGWYAYRSEDGSIELYANAEGESLHLKLSPTKKPAYHGQSGYVQRDGSTTNSSFYCSFTQMNVLSGKLLLDGKLEEVSGKAWMDHEKLTAHHGYFQNRWDRISLQLKSGEELLVFQSDETMFGSWINTAGEVQHLIRDEIEIENTEYWISPKTKIRYPVKRRLKVTPLGVDIEIKPKVLNQELEATKTAFAAYWDGEVSVSGSHSGDGYMELVGYDERVRARMLEFLIGH